VTCFWRPFVLYAKMKAAEGGGDDGSLNLSVPGMSLTANTSPAMKVVLIAIGLAGWLLYRFAGSVHQPAVQEQPPARPPPALRN